MREIVFHNTIYVNTSKWAACITNVFGKFDVILTVHRR